ncbi:MAG: helix-turn-helix domain-containing protein [Acidobacteria bacterium]|nr:helix-turn-helix domain-containing protein [Acidobacteriota bacterium]
MMTVPEAAAKVGRDPETVRRWIRSGRLRARKVGTQHVIDESDLEAVLGGEMLPLPKEWRRMSDRRPMINVVAAVRASRRGR